MVSSAIWKKKHAPVSFSKTIKIARVRRTLKTHECMFFQIARENILLLINNIHEKMIKNRILRRHLRTKLRHLSIVFLAY